MKILLVLAAVIIIGLLVSISLVGWAVMPFTGPRVGRLVTESRSIDPGGARLVEARFIVGSGTLSLRGGADRLMDAKFAYNVRKWKPEVECGVSDGVGKLTVCQPDTHGPVWGRTRNEWDVRLSDGTPIGLDIRLGNGDPNLDLTGLLVTNLRVETGNGDPDITLSGDYASLGEVDVKTGNGDVSVGFGRGEYASMSRLLLATGNGDIDAALTGKYATLSRITMETGNGDITADLSGEWKTNCDAVIRTGMSDITVRVPKTIGVLVDVEHGMGEVRGSGLRMEGDSFRNDMCGRSPVTMHVRVSTGMGDVTLE